MSFDTSGLIQKFNRAGTEYYENGDGEIVAKKCTKCKNVKQLHEFPHKIFGLGEHGSKCRLCARYHRISSRIRRRDSYYGVDTRITDKDVREVLSRFSNSCALTHSNDFHLDHVIPVSLGIVGGEIGNLIPLRTDLNMVKGSTNIFDWFADNRDRFGLEQRKFDELIEYLADINGMTTKEYGEYVRWCHDNPRTIGGIKAREASDDGATA